MLGSYPPTLIYVEVNLSGHFGDTHMLSGIFYYKNYKINISYINHSDNLTEFALYQCKFRI